ncbi:hypothetical protein D2C17_26060 [Salmonella enterica]|nr:hypothetical protein [Salmonella enterica]EAW1191992.1 hypothetical protein [Salmonella enterica subsp. enterica]EAM3007352.1 hypothetical protein [Salmonella enterica]EAO9288572.1 hypothetical protein [Salmonella enterica]EBJ3929208.1 hypothetical protein [Salmonella enterica]
MRTPDRGSTTGAASWTDDEPARRLPAGRAQRVNPPLTAILKKELVRKYGLFFSLSHLTGGMKTPDRGSTTGAASWTDDEPARRLPAGRAQRVNPPLTAILKKELVRKYGLFFSLSHLTGGMKTPDRGSTTGAASWTDDEPARRLPAGRAQRVNPPLTAILKKELVRKYGLFFT